MIDLKPDPANRERRANIRLIIDILKVILQGLNMLFRVSGVGILVLFKCYPLFPSYGVENPCDDGE